MSRFFIASFVTLSLAACDQPLQGEFDTDLENEWRAAAGASAAAGHGGSVDCGEQNVEAYSNDSGGDQCVHATFTNNCDSDMDIEPGDGDTVYVDPGQTKTFSWTIGSGSGIELDCDGSCEEEDCDGCEWELSFGSCDELSSSTAQLH